MWPPFWTLTRDATCPHKPAKNFAACWECVLENVGDKSQMEKWYKSKLVGILWGYANEGFFKMGIWLEPTTLDSTNRAQITTGFPDSQMGCSCDSVWMIWAFLFNKPPEKKKLQPLKSTSLTDMFCCRQPAWCCFGFPPPKRAKRPEIWDKTSQCDCFLSSMVVVG